MKQLWQRLAGLSPMWKWSLLLIALLLPFGIAMALGILWFKKKQA